MTGQHDVGTRPCGCERRKQGGRLHLCAYHDGWNDALDAADAAIRNEPCASHGQKHTNSCRVPIRLLPRHSVEQLLDDVEADHG